MTSLINTIIAFMITYNSQVINSNTNRAEIAIIGCISGGIMEYDVNKFTEQDFVSYFEYKYPICQQYIINNEKLFGINSNFIDWNKVQENLSSK